MFAGFWALIADQNSQETPMQAQTIVHAVVRSAETSSRERPSPTVAAAIGLGTLLGLCLAHLMALVTRSA